MTTAMPPVKPHHARALPLRVGTRGSPLALWQTRHFLSIITSFCPVLKNFNAFEEHAIADHLAEQVEAGGRMHSRLKLFEFLVRLGLRAADDR